MTQYQVYRLDDICHFTKGISPTLQTEPGDYPLVVTASYRRSASTYQLEGPAICIPLISSTGHGDAALHRVHYQEGKFALANLLVALTAKDSDIYYPKYLYYLLNAKKDVYFVPLMLGTANVSLKVKDIASLEIPLPSLEEQRRIVARIDELISQIEEGYGLRQNAIKEADTIYQNERDRIYRDIQDHRQPISSLFNLINGFAFKPDQWETSGRKIIRIQNLKYSDAPYNHYSLPVEDKFLVHKDDVLFAWSGQIVSLGAHIWDDDEAILNQHIFNVKANFPSLPEFIKEGFNALVDEMKNRVRGLEMFHIRKQELNTLTFPALSLEEQYRVVEYLSDLESKVDSIKQLQTETQAELNAFLPSVLDKAFKGEL